MELIGAEFEFGLEFELTAADEADNDEAEPDALVDAATDAGVDADEEMMGVATTAVDAGPDAAEAECEAEDALSGDAEGRERIDGLDFEIELGLDADETELDSFIQMLQRANN